MYDDEIRGALRTIADRERFETISPDPVIHRGRRGLRRRRMLSTGAAAVTVAAVTLSVAMLPNLGTADPDPAGQLTQLPGAGKGDQALEPIPEAEAQRRCRLQRSAQVGRDVGPVTVPVVTYTRSVGRMRADGGVVGRDPMVNREYRYLPGTVAEFATKDEKRFPCMIPGDSVPGAAALAEEAGEGSVPTDDASLLRRCSTFFWHDLTGWRVLARQTEPSGTAASVAAMSPSGKFVVHCLVTSPTVRRAMHNQWQWPSITGVEPPVQSMEYFFKASKAALIPGPLILGPAVQTCGKDSKRCVGWIFYDSGRVPENVKRLVAKSQDGRTFEIPVRDSWFAAAFAYKTTDGKHFAKGTITAYDAQGKNVGTVDYMSIPGE